MLLVERVTINPATEDPTLRPLDLVGLDGSWGIYLLAHDYPPPDLDVLHSSSADTEGDPVVSSRYLNRQMSHRIRVFEPSDPAGENKVPNPDFEVNTTGWQIPLGAWVFATATREQLPQAMLAPGTDYGARVQAVKDATATERFRIFETLTGVNGIPVQVGTTYCLSAYLWGTKLPTHTSGNNVSLAVQWYTAAGALVSTSTAPYVAVAPEELRRLSFAAAAPATAAFATVQVIGRSNTVSDVLDYFVDRVQFEVGAAPTSFIDGDVPGCDWTGTRHGSASTRPAPDGTRFSRICRDVTRVLDGIKTRKSGVLRRVSPLGGPLYYDLRTAKLTDAPQDISIGMKRAEFGLAFEALPGGRGTEIQIGGNFDEVTKPALVFLAENVPGELPALGRLVLEDRQGQNQMAAYVGLQRDTYSSSVDAELFYEAETRKLLGTSESVALAGASGAEGKAVKSAQLVKGWQGVVSTQAASGNHMAHFGSYRVLARIFRPTSNLGAVSIKLTWTQGDFVNAQENDEVNFGAEENQGVFSIEDLGIVSIDQAVSGAQRWEGRVLAKSTSTIDRVYVDCLFLVPVSECAGEAKANLLPAAPTTYGGFDSFEQGGGVLAGKAAQIGGNWGAAGNATDAIIDAVLKRAQRTAVSDVFNAPHYAPLGATKYTDVFLSSEWGNATNPAETSQVRSGIMVRYVNPENWLALVAVRNSTTTPSGGFIYYFLRLLKRVANVNTTLAQWISLAGQPVLTVAPGTSGSIKLEIMVLKSGDWFVFANGGVTPLALGNDAALATGGALQEGLVGLFDENQAATAQTRFWDNVAAYVPVYDKAIFANRQLEIRSDRARRQDIEGLTWGAAPYKGDYLLVPQAGPENRPTRLIVKASRNPDGDQGIDDLRANLYVTPRYLLAPPT
jgi:hypothetical protein